MYKFENKTDNGEDPIAGCRTLASRGESAELEIKYLI